jgi:hypothetical protein
LEMSTKMDTLYNVMVKKWRLLSET